MIVEENPRSITRRAEILQLVENCDCTFLTDVPAIRLSNTSIGPFKSGQTVLLPNWIAEVLHDQGLVKISGGGVVEWMSRLQALVSDEKNKGALQACPPLLYATSHRVVLSMKRDRTSIDPRQHDAIERVLMMLQTIGQSRLGKVIRLAKSGGCAEHRTRMTFEERWLCDIVSELVSAWYDAVVC